MMLVLVMIHVVIHCSYGLVLPEEPLTQILNKLITEILLEMPNCLVVVMSNNSFELHVPGYLPQMRASPDSKELPFILKEAYEMRCAGFLVDEKSSQLFLTALNAARMVAIGRLTPKILVIPNEVRSYEYSEELFRHPESAHIPDIIAIEIREEKNEFHLVVVTNDFQGKERSMKGKILGIWSAEDFSFFPDKMNDLGGKELITWGLNYPPYIQFEPLVDGIEVEVLVEFCKQNNCTVTFFTDDDLWGEIFENGTGNGILGNVFMDKADFGCGAFYIWERENHFIDYSYPYGNSRITALVPRPTKVAEWRTVFLPFSVTMWVLQVVSILMAFVVMLVVNKSASKMAFERVANSEFSTAMGVLLRAVGMSLLQPPSSNLSATALRRFFTAFELLFLFFTTLYSGALSSVLTVPKYNPAIDSPKKLYEAGIPWAAVHEAWINSLKGATEPHLKGLIKRFEVHDAGKLIELSKKGGYAFCIEIMEGGHVTQLDYISGEMVLNHHVMKTELYIGILALLLRKGSPYTEKLNQLLSRFRAAGLFQLLETDVTLRYLSSRLQIALEISKGSRTEMHHPTKLKIVHIQGAFILLALGLGISSFAFILERLKSICITK